MHSENQEIQHVWTCLPRTRQNQVVVAIGHMVQQWLTSPSRQQRQAPHNALDKTPTGDDIEKHNTETTI
jgi:hypothetical protein